VLRIPPLHLSDLLQIHLNRAVRDEFNVVEAHHPPPLPIDRRIARTDIGDRLTNRLPHRSAPARIERPHHLLATVRRWSRSEPERIDARNSAKCRLKSWLRLGHVVPPTTQQSRCLRAFHPQPRPQPRGRRSCNPHRQRTSDSRSDPSRDR